MSERARLLVLGLDSADAELIERWSDEGRLPTLARLRAEGAWGRIGTTSEVMHVSGWPSFYTGATPGAHGMYHAYQVRAGEQEVHRTRARECALPPFWKHLDDAGRACIVVDPFQSAPQPGFRGVEVLEYGTWTWFDEPAARPEGLWSEIQRRFGPYPAPEHSNVLVVPEPRRFRDQLVAGARVKGELVRWLCAERPWDVCFAMFGEPHPAGHYLWHAGDASRPAASNAPGADLSAVRDVYAAVDAAIGHVLEAIDERTRVLVLSGDGMGPNHAASHLVPELLHRLGLYHGADVGRAPADEPGPARAAVRRSPARVLRDLVPFRLRRAVSRCMPAAWQHRLSMRWANADIDWARTRVFMLPNANEAFLRVNRSGREPRGVVAPGAQTAELLAALAREGAALCADGPLVHAVHDVDRVFPGPLRPNLPDLVWTWDPAARCADVLHASVGAVRGKTPWETAPFYSGNHRPNAFLLARGPGFAPGSRLEGVHLLDLAPSILAQQGVPAPPHHAGRALAALAR